MTKPPPTYLPVTVIRPSGATQQIEVLAHMRDGGLRPASATFILQPNDHRPGKLFNDVYRIYQVRKSGYPDSAWLAIIESDPDPEATLKKFFNIAPEKT